MLVTVRAPSCRWKIMRMISHLCGIKKKSFVLSLDVKLPQRAFRQILQDNNNPQQNLQTQMSTFTPACNLHSTSTHSSPWLVERCHPSPAAPDGWGSAPPRWGCGWADTPPATSPPSPSESPSARSPPGPLATLAGSRPPPRCKGGEEGRRCVSGANLDKGGRHKMGGNDR